MAFRSRHKIPLSLDHFEAALYHAEIARLFETRSDAPGPFHPNVRHQASVVASIFAAVAFLEAYINEFFSDQAEDIFAKSADKAVRSRRYSALWELGIPRTSRYSVLEKYQVALSLADQPRFPEGENPFQDVKLVTRLRNVLVHFEPEWQEAGTNPEDTPSLSRALRGRFALNPLLEEHERLFPQRVLSAAAAVWATDAAWNLIAAFNAAIGNLFTPHALDELRRLKAAVGM